MDSLLSGLFGDQEDPEQKRAQVADFVQRVESGPPTEGVSDEEALKNYSAVAGRLSPQELEEAATQALERFSPEQRREFASLLEARGGSPVNPDDPRQIAQLTTQLQNQSPDGLIGLLGGGSLDDVLGGLLGGGTSDGGGGGVVSDLLGGLFGGNKDSSSGGGATQSGGMGDLLNNPIAKAVLAAIAAMAMKKFMGGGDEDASSAQGGASADDDTDSTGGLKGANPRRA